MQEPHLEHSSIDRQRPHLSCLNMFDNHFHKASQWVCIHTKTTPCYASRRFTSHVDLMLTSQSNTIPSRPMTWLEEPSCLFFIFILKRKFIAKQWIFIDLSIEPISYLSICNFNDLLVSCKAISSYWFILSHQFICICNFIGFVFGFKHIFMIYWFSLFT